MTTMLDELDTELQDGDTEQSRFYEDFPDTAFTQDEQEAIRRFKTKEIEKLNRSRAVLKGIESCGWGVTSYCLAKYLVIATGSAGLLPAVAIVLGINQIVNRDLLEFTVNKSPEGWVFTDMDKAIKFLFQTIFGCFILWTAIGDFYTTMQNSHKTYDNIKATVEDFNRLPESDKTIVFLVGALVAGGVVYGIHKSKS
ncbi:hypothetical protein [Nostoc sp. ATCC 53789]|uniref:hypothetical protein n=1 Tax=Nostoc sp. ATCC 53789 TaxID=76335 RepID=UPI000DEC95E7|nr:hypothetical protein [Nostoc sp. ATCC 53789]QHG21262.1 hypothetical protein GJB62_36055 [Nostoc sp. ATCC 53789]RCJ16653.1 hypothetical protein A6V25_30635 [Nostoc sp. ATCC 53789]